jgi:hypothetical protein
MTFDMLEKFFSGSHTGSALKVYLRLLAVCYLLGAFFHAGNMLGYGSMPWNEMPVAWRRMDVIYLFLNAGVFFGLMRCSFWGTTLFVIAAVSEIAAYGMYPYMFAETPEQFSQLYGLILFRVITLIVLLAFLKVTR